MLQNDDGGTQDSEETPLQQVMRQNPTLVDTIVMVLLENDEVDLAVIRAGHKHVKDVDLELAIHAARERVRVNHDVDFAPVKGRGGVIRKANDGQIANRSRRGRRAGLKKLVRAADRMDMAARQASVPSDKEKFEKQAGSQRTQLTAAKLRGSRLRDLLDKK